MSVERNCNINGLINYTKFMKTTQLVHWLILQITIADWSK